MRVHEEEQSVMRVLVIGATGSIDRLVVDEALAQGHQVRALVRDAALRGYLLPSSSRRVI